MDKVYEIIEVEQGTPEWLDLRKRFITASQVPILMGHSPYQTRQQLLDEKIFGIEVDNSGKQALFAKGHRIEKDMRDLLNSQGHNFIPRVVVSKTIPDLMASLDGLEFVDGEDVVLEVKYVGQKRLEEIRGGAIPHHHRIQVQAQILSTGARNCLYVACDGASYVSVTFKPDGELHQSIEKEIKKAKEEIETQKPNNVAYLPVKKKAETPRDVPFLTIEDQRLRDLYQLKILIEDLNIKYEGIKKNVIEVYKTYPKLRGNGIKIVRSFRKGSIKYSEIPEVKKLDLEKYRGPDSEVVTISLDEEYNHDEI